MLCRARWLAKQVSVPLRLILLATLRGPGHGPLVEFGNGLRGVAGLLVPDPRASQRSSLPPTPHMRQPPPQLQEGGLGLHVPVGLAETSQRSLDLEWPVHVLDSQCGCSGYLGKS